MGLSLFSIAIAVGPGLQKVLSNPLLDFTDTVLNLFHYFIISLRFEAGVDLRVISKEVNTKTILLGDHLQLLRVHYKQERAQDAALKSDSRTVNHLDCTSKVSYCPKIGVDFLFFVLCGYVPRLIELSGFPW
eukprot:sb/3474950/